MKILDSKLYIINSFKNSMRLCFFEMIIENFVINFTLNFHNFYIKIKVCFPLGKKINKLKTTIFKD